MSIQPVIAQSRSRRLVQMRVDDGWLWRVYLVSFVLRALIGVMGYLVTQYGGLSLLEDALYYEQVGHSVANDWWSGRPSTWLDTVDYGGRVAWLMVASVAGIYFVLGIRSVPLLLIVYSAITALVPVYIYRLARQLGASDRAAKQGAWLVALSPAFVFWSGALYKEGLVLLTLSVAAYHTLRLQARWDVRSAVVVGLAIFGMLGLRFYLAPLIGTAAIVALVWGRGGTAAQPVAHFLFRQGVAVCVVLAIILAFGFSQHAEQSLMETESGVLKEIELNRRDMATRGQSGYLTTADVSTVEGATRFIPIGLAYFLTVPHPWQLGSFRQNLIIPETLFWIALYPLIIMGFVRGCRANPTGTLYILLVTGGVCLIYAMLAGNIGSAYRMRSQAWLLWAPFAAWGYEVWRERRARAGAGDRGQSRVGHRASLRGHRRRLGRYSSGRRTLQ